MKTRLTTHRYFYTLFLILSSHSIFTMFAREDLPRDPNIHRQEESPEQHFLRTRPIFESYAEDKENTEEKPAFRFTFTRYAKSTKPRTFPQPSEIDPKKPVRLISKQEMDNRERISALIIEATILLGTGATSGAGAAAGAGVATGAGLGIAALLGPLVPIIAVPVAIGLTAKWIAKSRGDKKVENTKGKSETSKGGNGGGGGGKDPDKDPNKNKNNSTAKHLNGTTEKRPNGVYENNPKHHQNSPGNIGKAPRDGQKALDESISVPNKDYRIGIQDGKIVQLRPHGPGEYHAYIVEEFHELDMEAQKALCKADLVRSIKSGKIKS